MRLQAGRPNAAILVRTDDQIYFVDKSACDELIDLSKYELAPVHMLLGFFRRRFLVKDDKMSKNSTIVLLDMIRANSRTQPNQDDIYTSQSGAIKSMCFDPTTTE